MAAEDRELREIFRYGQKIQVVAHEGFNHDWAVYAESNESRELGNSAEVILEMGSKLSYEQGASAFPHWDEGPLNWRE